MGFLGHCPPHKGVGSCPSSYLYCSCPTNGQRLSSSREAPDLMNSLGLGVCPPGPSGISFPWVRVCAAAPQPLIPISRPRHPWPCSFPPTEGSSPCSSLVHWDSPFPILDSHLRWEGPLSPSGSPTSSELESHVAKPEPCPPRSGSGPSGGSAGRGTVLKPRSPSHCPTLTPPLASLAETGHWPLPFRTRRSGRKPELRRG